MEFTALMLEPAMVYGEASLLEDQLRWAVQRLPHDRVNPELIVDRLRIFRDVTAELLPQGAAEQVDRYLLWMIDRLQELIAGSP